MSLNEESGPISIEGYEGKVVVYKRPKNRTRYYYASIKLPHNGKWKKLSLKTDDLKEAQKKAKEEYDLIKLKIAHNMPIDSRSFRAVAEAGIKRLEDLLNSGRGKVSYKDYINCLKRFKEFFGLKSITSFGHQDLIELDNYRNNQLGRKAAKSTINTHNAALNWLFDFALKNGWIHQSQIPQLDNHGRGGERRPSFSEDEIPILKESILINPPLNQAGWKTPVILKDAPITPKRKPLSRFMSCFTTML